MAKSVWDEVKDLFKSEEQKEREKQQKLSEAKQKESDVIEKLKQLDEEYVEPEVDVDSLFPYEKLEEKQPDAMTDEDIHIKAEKELEEEQKAKRDELNSKYEDKKSKYDDDYENAKKRLKDAYESAKGRREREVENAKDSALRGGIQRGSILPGEIEKAERDERDDKRVADMEYSTKIDSLDKTISALESERQQAISDLDEEYARKLEKRIDELTRERDDILKETEDYNNSVRKKNAEMAKDRNDKIYDYLSSEQKAKEEREKKGIFDEKKQENYLKRYEIARDFYLSLSEDIAYDALMASPDIRYYLGEYYFNKLSKELKPKTERKVYV